MIYYFIIFVVIGILIQRAIGSNKIISLAIILGISIMWGFVHKPIFGLVDMGEMFLGYFLAMIYDEQRGSSI